ncbi:Protein C25F9.2 protein [Aphelenchoides avenae]|nr:Protein C25F9.2 protein [Aphelenchus avenae]
MSRPLDDLVSAYGLKEIYGVEPKSIFPHGFNDPRNYTLPTLPHLPPFDTYYPDGMKPSKRARFEAEYARDYNTPTALLPMLEEYCLLDVGILKYALVEFRREWIAQTGDDILRHSITIASACIRHFRKDHMEAGSLVRVPEYGYERRDNQSVIGLNNGKFHRYLMWYAEQNKDVKVQHRNNGGEYQFKHTDGEGKEHTLRLDGYVERPGQRPLAIEVYG